MERYKNLSGFSGILEYEVGEDFIRIKFKEGGTYEYTYDSTGKSKIEQMKKLARCGFGLSTFININVREKFARKLF